MDLTQFPNANLNIPELQNEVTQFVSSVILNHEKIFYELIHKNSKDISIISTRNSTIIKMIVESITDFYNKLYYQIQHNITTPSLKMITYMSTLADYAPHIILDKLFRLTLDTHTQIDREKIKFDDNQESILTQINTYFSSINIVHLLFKNVDIPFKELSEGEKAYRVDITFNK